MGGGGVVSEYDPIHKLQYTLAEIRAAVQAAEGWGTYVLAHAYTSEQIQRLVENGVKCIEHGMLLDEKTAKLIAQRNVVLAAEFYVFDLLADIPGINQDQLDKNEIVRQGRGNLVRLIKKYNITTGFSTDFGVGYLPLGKEFTAREKYWTPAKILRLATSRSGRVIRMGEKLNRYGNFGQICEGWVADLVLIDGEVLENISVLSDPATIVLVLKDGVIMKSYLDQKES